MIFNRKVTALVPVKDHSERVIGKNFRDFCGLPLYHHILLTLDKTYAVDEIVVNTDSPRVILEAPKISSKIKVHERPTELCGDCVSTNKLFAYDLERTDANIYIQTHATNPLLKAETIAQALRKFVDLEATGVCDSLFSVNVFHSRFYFADGRAVNHNPDELQRTQDLPPLYEENSCIYVFTKASFAKKQRRIGEMPQVFPTPSIESVDIDDEFNFKQAELLALYSQKIEGRK